MKQQLLPPASLLAAIGMLGWLVSLPPAASQETPNVPGPTVPREGVGGPNPVDLSSDTQKPDADPTTGTIPRNDLTLLEIVSGSVDYTTLAGALRAARLDDRLKDDGPITLLAPHNDAFAALPQGVLLALMKPENIEALKKLLTYHMIPGKVASSAIVPGVIATVQGEPLTVVGGAEGAATIQGAGFGTTDIAAKNGVIHTVKAVFIPPSMNLETFKSRANGD